MEILHLKGTLPALRCTFSGKSRTQPPSLLPERELPDLEFFEFLKVVFLNIFAILENLFSFSKAEVCHHNLLKCEQKKHIGPCGHADNIDNEGECHRCHN